VQDVFVSPSIGIALSETPENRAEGVLRRGDLAMYAAKRGKAECQVYSPRMEARVAERMDLERDLRRAIVPGEGTLVEREPLGEPV